MSSYNKRRLKVEAQKLLCELTAMSREELDIFKASNKALIDKLYSAIDRDGEITFETWILELAKVCARYNSSIDGFEGWDNWKEYYDQDYSPKDAYMESHRSE